MKVHRHTSGGSTILLDGNEVARAIDLYIASHGIIVVGPRTVNIDGHDSVEPGHTPGADVFVDPSGRVLVQGDLVPFGVSVSVNVVASTERKGA